VPIDLGMGYFYVFIWFFFAREKYIDCYEERGLKWPFSLLFWRKGGLTYAGKRISEQTDSRTEKNV
jgi:hypothetical protein